jgi:hypothetical protein
MNEHNPTPEIRLTPERRLALMVQIVVGHLASGQIDPDELVSHAEAMLDILIELIQHPIELGARFGEISPIAPSPQPSDPIERKYRIQLEPKKRLEFLVQLVAGASAIGTQAPTTPTMSELGDLLDRLVRSVEEHVSMQPDQFDLPPRNPT